MTFFFLVVALTLTVSAFCSLLEATLYSTRIATLEAAAKTKPKRSAALRFLQMKKDVSAPTSAILILNTIANTAGASIAGMYAAQVFGTSWVLLFSIALTFSILFFSEILPKTYGATRWRTVWSLIVWPLAFIEKALSPLILVTQRFARIFTSEGAAPIITEDEILAMIHVGARSGQLTAAELKMLDAVLHFDKTLARQVMVPRNEIVIFDVNWSLSECINLAGRTEHTRYPICKGSVDEILGIIHIKDLLGMPATEEVDLTTLMRPIRHVPETKKINELLTEMQRNRQHMAAVVDEHGGTAGIVTLENVLEEIVGSVQDEFDHEVPDFQSEGNNSYLVRGRTPLETINREFHLELRAPGVNTLSGFLVAQVGRFLKTGDTVKLSGAVAEVVAVEGNKAVKVRLRLTPGADNQ